VRGRPKRKFARLAERALPEFERRARRALRIGVIFPVIVGNTVWRIKRRPVWVIWAAKDAALSVAEDPAWRQSARRSSHIELLSGPIIGRVESETVPGTRW